MVRKVNYNFKPMSECVYEKCFDFMADDNYMIQSFVHRIYN